LLISLAKMVCCYHTTNFHKRFNTSQKRQLCIKENIFYIPVALDSMTPKVFEGAVESVSVLAENPSTEKKGYQSEHTYFEA
jgi:hypothetical protein